MNSGPHYLFDVIMAAISTGLLWTVASWTSGLAVRRRFWMRLAILVYGGIIWSGAATSTVRVSRLFPNLLVVSVRAVAITLVVVLFYSFVLALVYRRIRAHSPVRRTLLKSAVVAAAATPMAVTAFAILKREELTYRELDIRIPSLPPALNGLRLVQLTDIHLSPLVSERLLDRAVGMANETNAHIALVTGDLISRGGDPLDKCLRHLARLRSDAGTFGCLGNHEIYANAESYTAHAGTRLGMKFLRSESQALRFGGGTLNLVGVDYQRKSRPYLRGISSLILPGTTNILLSHNPDVFPVAARQGFDLTIAGHTHGGQVNFEIVHPWLNIVRFKTPYVYGEFEQEGRTMYVSRGIGTIGVPARLNAPPEVALIRLCAISS